MPVQGSHTQQPGEVLLVNGYSGVDAEERAALAHVPQSSRMHGVAGPPRKALVLYSLGNFCTTMFNELCRVGLLLTLLAAALTLVSMVDYLRAAWPDLRRAS